MGDVRMDGSYDRVSAIQRTFSGTISRYLASTLENYRDAESVTIADLGCATGGNSLRVFTPLLEKFRAQSKAQVLIYHTDLPGNEWNTLFNSLENSSDGYRNVEDVHSFAIGKSFYSQCFPNNFIDISYASCTFHWLSCPSEGRNQLYPLILKFDDYETNLPQRMREDLNTILTHRYAELRPGGHLMFSVPLFNTSRRDVLAPMVEVAYQMQDSRLLPPSFVESLQCPFGLNTFQNILSIISDFSPAFEVVSCQEISRESLIYKRFRVTGEVDRFAAEMKGFYKGILRPYLLSLFKDEAEGGAKVSRYFDLVEEFMLNHPEPIFHSFGYFHLRKPVAKV